MNIVDKILNRPLTKPMVIKKPMPSIRRKKIQKLFYYGYMKADGEVYDMHGIVYAVNFQDAQYKLKKGASFDTWAVNVVKFSKRPKRISKESRYKIIR